MKEEQKRQAKLLARQLDVKEMREAEEYNPFGRAGAGAPNRDFQAVPPQTHLDVRRSVDN
jgi:hypothetical protein